MGSADIFVSAKLHPIIVTNDKRSTVPLLFREAWLVDFTIRKPNEGCESLVKFNTDTSMHFNG